jgi:hypothetical protein
VGLLSRLRRWPWLSGALLLSLAAAVVAPAVYELGWRRWPLYCGLLAALLLVFGWIERRWKSRPVPRGYRVADRSRFRVVPGGKGKANGKARDVHEDRSEDGDKPRWLM